MTVRTLHSSLKSALSTLTSASFLFPVSAMKRIISTAGRCHRCFQAWFQIQLCSLAGHTFSSYSVEKQLWQISTLLSYSVGHVRNQRVLHVWRQMLPPLPFSLPQS